MQLRALVVKGASDGALIVSKQKIPPASIAESKKKCGGSAVIKGAVFYEDGKFVFETGKPPAATLPNALKLIAKRDAGLSIVAICRMGTDPVLFDEEDGAPASTAGGLNTAATPAAGTAPAAKPTEQAAKAKAGNAPTANPDEAAYQRVAALTGDLKKAIVSGTPAGNEAKLRFSESQVFSRKKDFAQAVSLLGIVEDAIKKALNGAISRGRSCGRCRFGHRRRHGDCGQFRGGPLDGAAAGRREAVSRALENQPSNANQLRSVLAFADGKAEANDFAKASARLGQSRKALADDGRDRRRRR